MKIILFYSSRLQYSATFECYETTVLIHISRSRLQFPRTLAPTVPLAMPSSTLLHLARLSVPLQNSLARRFSNARFRFSTLVLRPPPPKRQSGLQCELNVPHSTVPKETKRMATIPRVAVAALRLVVVAVVAVSVPAVAGQLGLYAD